MSVRPLGKKKSSAADEAAAADDPQPQKPMASPAQDVRRLKENSSAVASELRDFLRRMEGKSPREMMGAVASSSLFKALTSSTVIVAIGVAIFTVVPWAWGRVAGPEETQAPSNGEAPQEEVAAAEPGAEGESPTGDGETPAEAEGPAVLDPNAANLDDPNAVADRLGVGGVLEAPANSNPLDNSNDDILKDLE